MFTSCVGLATRHSYPTHVLNTFEKKNKKNREMNLSRSILDQLGLGLLIGAGMVLFHIFSSLMFAEWQMTRRSRRIGCTGCAMKWTWRPVWWKFDCRKYQKGLQTSEWNRVFSKKVIKEGEWKCRRINRWARFLNNIVVSNLLLGRFGHEWQHNKRPDDLP